MAHRGRNRPAANGGPQGIQRSFASQLREHEPLFNTYEHLQGLPRGDAALTMLRKVASMVKPIMRKRGWRVQTLAEFLPQEPNLLGLNINRGYKICIRLRYHNNPDLFLPLEEVIDTTLHELSHIVWGEHDANFHRLWDELRDEQETLLRKGFTGEGFLSDGHRLGGGGHMLPPHEMRRLARASAEKRQRQNKLTKGSGQRLGGAPIHLQGGDVRQIIASQVMRRNTISTGCASGRQDAGQLSDQSANNTFKTKAEEDDANNRAIAQALFELMQEEEERKLQGTFSAAPTDGQGLAWHPENGLYDPRTERQAGLTGPQTTQLNEGGHTTGALQDSARSRMPPDSLNYQGEFRPDGSRSIGQHPNSTPQVPVGSKPSPVSAVSPSQRPYSNSPVSPLNSGASSTSAHPAPPRSVPAQDESPIIDISEPFNPTHTPPDQWTCEICTCINPLRFLACDACGTEKPQPIGIGNSGRRPRPQPPPATLTSAFGGEGSTPDPRTHSLGWICTQCGAFMEHRWWTCSACGQMKGSS